MKNVFLVLSLLFVIAIPASSQTIRFLPDPNAVLVDQFPITVHVGLGSDGVPYVSRVASTTTGDVITVLGGYRSQSGRIEYQFLSDSIRYNGPNDIIDNTPTTLLYGFLAQEAVIQGVLRGYTPAPDCSAPCYTSVYSEPCVSRIGTGTGTHFVPSDRTNYSTWKFSVCRSSTESAPTVAGVGCYNPNTCGNNCEPTCPNGNGSTIQ